MKKINKLRLRMNRSNIDKINRRVEMITKLTREFFDLTAEDRRKIDEFLNKNTCNSCGTLLKDKEIKPSTLEIFNSMSDEYCVFCWEKV